jgi:6-phosphogluconate dehydrogenase
MKIGFIGLGRMGSNMVLNILSKKHDVVAYNRSPEPVRKIARRGAIPAYSIEELVRKLPKRKIVFIMVTAGKAVDEIIGNLANHLKKGDIVIDSGNSFYLDSVRRAKKLKRKGISFLDVGTSGGVSGARYGACYMIGGDKEAFKVVEKVFRDTSVKGGYGYFGKAGSGHFVKMVHNGIEYGMMQAIGEGFEIVEKSGFRIDKEKLAEVYSNGSVIRGWLMELLHNAYKNDKNLSQYSGAIGLSGEGEWTVRTAKKLNVPVPVIEASVRMRLKSAKNRRYQGKVIQALRFGFGRHPEPK